MNLAGYLALVCALCLVGCSADVVQTPQTPSTEPPASTATAPKPPSSTAPVDPGPQRTEDFPASCVAARFTADGIDMKDVTTGLTWIATDVAYQDPATATLACGAGGFRPATTAEVLAIATAIPGCTLPGLMHAVYAWAPNAKSSGPLPVVTSDGCVDVKAGVSFVGVCHLTDVVDEASTLCVK